MRVYDRLHDHLATLPGSVDSVKLSFSEIEEILERSLPPSARKYLAWWSNSPSHSEARAWTSAGWKVSKVSLRRESLTFSRGIVPPGPKLAKEGPRPRLVPDKGVSDPLTLQGTGQRTIVDYAFSSLGPVAVSRNADGTPWSHQPQLRYAKAASSTLNRYGSGEFCEIRAAAAPHREGVYALFVGEDLVYVGEAVDLHKRWYHYGHISPRACYLGGQETNCRVNKLILEAARKGQPLGLWFHPTGRRKEIEAELRRELRPPWNAV